MTSEMIENYLAQWHLKLDRSIAERIEKMRQEAIAQQNEELANYCWCMRQVYAVQSGFLSAFSALKENEYEKAWDIFDKTDKCLSAVERNLDGEQLDDRFHLMFIGRMIKEYQKLFPYRHFLSRECVIKEEKCSICGKPISLRHSCGHKVGYLYMGELCTRIITKMEPKGVSIVTDPFDKYAFVRVSGQEYNYGMLEKIMRELQSPYDKFHVDIQKVIDPAYRNTGRNDACPCGSGKKYKVCHMGSKDELIDHYHVVFNKPQPIHYVAGSNEIFGTWK